MLPKSLKICGFHLEIGSENWLVIEMDNIALGSVDNGVFVLFGETALPTKLRSPIITGSNHDYGKT
jgi:hypothetical protein